MIGLFAQNGADTSYYRRACGFWVPLFESYDWYTLSVGAAIFTLIRRMSVFRPSDGLP